MYAAADATLHRALRYALHGWPVFPCRPGGKEPATRHGFRDASTDPGQIRRWWSRHAEENLAIATGTPGPDVLDVDQHGEAGNGFAAWRRLSVAGLLDGTIAIVATPVAACTPTSPAPRSHPGGYLTTTWISRPSAATCSHRLRKSEGCRTDCSPSSVPQAASSTGPR